MKIKSYLAAFLLFAASSCAKPDNKNIKLPDPSPEELEEVDFGKKSPPPAKKAANPEEDRQAEAADKAPVRPAAATGSLKGWDRLAKRLVSEGIDQVFVEKVFSDPRMPSFETVTFSISPKESHTLYTIFLNEKRLKEAHDFYDQWKTTLKAAEKKYGVPAGVITAIMYVETGFGKHTGNQIVLNRLSRLANIGEPDNLRVNTTRLLKSNPDATAEQVSQRAEYLEKTFYPEVLALFRLASVRKLDLLMLKGSSAGAFGLAQFLPSSYVKYAVDGNNNGTISLFEVEDAIYSIGNFLASNGWKAGMSSHKDQMAVLWNYNRSEAYGEMILKVAGKLE